MRASAIDQSQHAPSLPSASPYTSDTKNIEGNLYTPKVEDVKKIRVATSSLDLSRLTKKDAEKEDTLSQYSPRSSSGDSFDSPRSNGESADASNTITLVTPAVVTKIISPCHVDDDDEPQIPWRTNLRKTNSKLSLLD